MTTVWDDVRIGWYGPIARETRFPENFSDTDKMRYLINKIHPEWIVHEWEYIGVDFKNKEDVYRVRHEVVDG
ncbi:MAG: hypothetical protein WC822_04575 [Candidatus Paceibacterota bacterium]|jgi:hypothetical protein